MPNKGIKSSPRNLHKDPTHNIKFSFRLSREIHTEMKLLACKRSLQVQDVYREALEYLLTRREQDRLWYYAPPMKKLAIDTTIWIPRSLNDRIYELGHRDERPLGAIAETAAIIYLLDHSDFRLL